MEASPSSPSESLDHSSESSSDDTKKEKKTGKKGSFSLRVPLPADALHGDQHRLTEGKGGSIEAPEGILPIFPKRAPHGERPADVVPVAPVAETSPPEPTPEEKLQAHPDLSRLHHELWQSFDVAPQASFDVMDDHRGATEHAIEAASDDDEEHEAREEKDKDKKAKPIAERPVQRQEIEMPEPDSWHESHTLHLNEPEPIPEQASEEYTPAAPTAAGIAAEVAATEPDQQSMDDLERAFSMPAAQLPSTHPEAQARPMPPMTEQQRFQDMMQRAEFSDDFVQQTSLQPRPVPQSPQPGNVEPYRFSTVPEEAASEQSYRMPPSEVGASQPAIPAESVPIAPAAQWYANRYYQPVRPAAAMEGAVAGAIAGGIAGRMAAERQQPLQPAPRPTAEQSPTVRTLEVAATAEQQVAAAATAEQQPPETAEHRTHTVESAWHRVQVENGTNRIVEGQPEGKALLEEKRAESTPVATATQDDAAQQSDDASVAGGTYQQPLQGVVPPMIGSGQVNMTHELRSGLTDYDHRLEVPRNPVVTALTSPLLWVGIVVLLIAFFAAAFL